LNTLLFIDTNNDKIDEFGKMVYLSTREWVVIEILFKEAIDYAAIPLAERLLTTTMKYEITDLTIRILERLKGVYATKIGNKKKYQEYKEKFWYYKAVLDSEYLVKEVFQEFRLEYVKSVSFRPENAAKGQKALEELKPLLEKYGSLTFLHFYNVIEVSICQAKRDHEGVLAACENAIYLLKQKMFNLNNAIALYQNQKTIALLMLQRYEACKIAINESLEIQEIGHFNWFKTMETKTLLAFHTSDYTEGYDTFVEALNVKQFRNLEGHNAEIWLIFKYYLYLAAALGKLPNRDKNTLGSFKLKKFNNEFDLSKDDKKGMNITILTLRIALMITEKMHDSLIDNIENIEKYLVRNVPKSDAAAYRTNLFIKLLLEIPKAGFNRVLLERRTQSIIKDMVSVPYNIVEAGYKIEVIPYEILWAELLQFFGSKTLDIAKLRKKTGDVESN
jgi:hypothetical protein